MKILCNILGHKWIGYISSITGLKLRTCKRCRVVQQYVKRGQFASLEGFVDMIELKKAGYKIEMGHLLKDQTK